MEIKSAGQNTAFSTNKTLNIKGRLLDLTTPKVMGILNVTPDSFYEGSRFSSDKEILTQGEKMIREGVDIIDVGGYSSRPGADDIAVKEELQRSLSAIAILIKEFPNSIISIDTFRSEVAHEAISMGASIINDISAGELDNKMFETVAKLKVPYIAMHMRGTPQTMKGLTSYENLLLEITSYFQKRISALNQFNITDAIIDPGFGFAKTIEQNFKILSHLPYFKVLEKPILIGVSRKSMIWKTLNIKPEEALNGSTALNMAALINGASIIRTHDVKETVEVISLYSNMKS